MSWEIVYGKQFIKTDKGIIPLVLSGSNNCYEGYGRSERRARNWSVFFSPFYDKIIYTEKEIKDIINNLCENTTYEEWFKTSYSGSFLDNEKLKKFYNAAIKKAMSIEDIKKNSKFGESLHCCIIHYLEGCEQEKILEKYIDKTEDLEMWVEQAIIKRDELGKSAYIIIGFLRNDPIKFNANIKQKEFKDGEMVVMKYRNKYIIDIEGNGLSYCKELDERVLITTYAKAVELVKNKKGYENSIKIVKYNPPKEKNFIIKFDNENAGGWIVRLTKYGFKYSCTPKDRQVKKFESEKQASNFIEKIKGRMGNKNNYEVQNLINI